jgi:hypothetical protein
LRRLRPRQAPYVGLEGLLIKGFVDAGTLLAAAGGGRLLNKSMNASGVKERDGDIRGHWSMVWTLVAKEGWEHAGTKKAPWVLLDGPNVRATRSSVGAARSILRKPSGERYLVVAGVRGRAQRGGGHRRARVGRLLGLRDETSEQMFLRGQGIRERYEPIARDLLLLRVS